MQSRNATTPRLFRHLKIRSLDHLAQRLGVPLEVLERVAHYAPLLYNPTWAKQKKNGSTREIDVPKPLLMDIQKRIHARLLSRVWLPEAIHGYRRMRSIVTATEMHVAAPHLWVTDISSFYPSVSAWNVRHIFMELKCSPDVSSLLTRLTTHRYRLPQGAATSPSLANLHLRISRIAERIEGLAREHELQVSFFGDDILVSGEHAFSYAQATLTEIIRKSGLKLNRNKTVVSSPRDKHHALGIVLNARGTERDVPRTYRRELRRLVYLARRYGLDILRAKGLTDADPRQFLNGKISFAASVNNRNRRYFGVVAGVS